MATNVAIAALTQFLRAAGWAPTPQNTKKPPESMRTVPLESRATDNVCVFTVDVEDWFHILDVDSAPAFSTWSKLPSRIERNFSRLLDLFSEHHVRVTCFFLGWVGERFPHLVREAVNRGHEVASHGYQHRLAFRMTPQEFHDDALHSRIVLEDISGRPVLGYRAAGFSAVEHTPWFFEQLEAAGYIYDSSAFPAKRQHGGMVNFHRMPHVIHGTQLVEFPITVSDFLGQPICFFGGGYLRLFPEWLILREANEVLRRGRPVIFYIHPREIDVHQPRLEMNFARRFKSYVNLSTTEHKITRILKEFRVIPFEDFIYSYSPALQRQAHTVA